MLIKLLVMLDVAIARLVVLLRILAMPVVAIVVLRMLAELDVVVGISLLAMLDVFLGLRLPIELDFSVGLRLPVELLRLVVVVVGWIFDKLVVLTINLWHVLAMWDQVVVGTSMMDCGY